MQTQRRRMRNLVTILASSMAAIVLVAVAPLAALAVDNQTNRAQLFANAAQEFNVPVDVLLAVSYNESRWDTHGVQASVNGGYGLMNLTSSSAPQEDGRGDASRPVTDKVDTTKTYTLDEASKLLGVSADSLKREDKQNVRGAAAVLAEYAKQTNDGSLPSDMSDWYAAVAKFSGNANSQMAQDFADSVYQTMQSGVQRQTNDGQIVALNKSFVKPDKSSLSKLHFKNQTKTQPNGTDCPSDLTCRFIPAGYAANSTDPADYGNYDPANRPKDMQIKYIVIHDTEGSYDSAIDHFQDTTAYVSAHYVIRSSDGAVTEMVRPKDVAWAAGNWYMNMHSINIEHEGFASDGAGWYTEAMYQSSAKLVRYLAKQYNIPLDRQHIIGHDEVSKTSAGSVASSHWDPGAFWDWSHYMELVRGKTTAPHTWSPEQQLSKNKTVEISPDFATNQSEVTDCTTGTCVTLPKQRANFVYLHTQPNADSPLLTNKYMHPDSSPGTTAHEDWSAKATDGQRFVVADVQGDWTGIWYGSTVGWFYNPHGQNTHIVATKTIKARAGLNEIPVYVTAYPETSAYPVDVTPASQNQLYSMPKEQLYTVLSSKNPTDYFYDATINFSKPHDHEIFTGQNKYIEISYNHRVAFVNASDVVFK